MSNLTSQHPVAADGAGAPPPMRLNQANARRLGACVWRCLSMTLAGAVLSEVLDDFFGYSEGEGTQQRYEQIELAVQKHTVEVVTSDFQRVLDQLKVTLNRCGKTLGQLLFGEQPPRAPRYFQVVFLALHKLIVVQNQEVVDQDQLAIWPTDGI